MGSYYCEKAARFYQIVGPAIDACWEAYKDWRRAAEWAARPTDYCSCRKRSPESIESDWADAFELEAKYYAAFAKQREVENEAFERVYRA